MRTIPEIEKDAEEIKQRLDVFSKNLLELVQNLNELRDQLGVDRPPQEIPPTPK